jgi:corrinoid protein of di/trimethylamine methyltransferase
MSLDSVKKTLIDLDIDNIQKVVNESLKSEKPENVLKALSEGMLEVGKKYEAKEYYLPELVLAGETMEDALKVLRPKLKMDKASMKGTVVAATVKGDLHDIGKNIVVTMLSAAGYNVVDLGKDIDAKTIVAKAKENKADIIAVSALLTMTVVEIRSIVEELKKEGLRDKIKIICGGAPLNQELAEKLGADISCDDAVQGIEVCNKIMSAKKKK